MNIIFDGNYLIHKCFSVWCTYYQNKSVSLEENELIIKNALLDKEKKQVLVRKIIIDLCASVRRFSEHPKSVVIVIDSHSWRYRLFDNYKYALTRIRGLYNQEFYDLIDYMENLLRNKGLIVSRCSGAEGDDLVYLWSIYFNQVLEEECVIISGDSDLRQIVNTDTAVFNNNSKNLRLFCTADKVVYWSEKLDVNIMVESTNPFEILLYKVIMGDKSDNIPKIKSGVGEVGFKKFLDSIKPYTQPQEGTSLTSMAMWIADRFSKFGNIDYADTLGKVLFNLKMVWLNLETYSDVCRNVLVNILNDINKQKNTYNYYKIYDLENFYNMTIK